MQARWTKKGIPSKNESYFLVEDYLNKKMLSRAGYTLDLNECEVYEVEAYAIIENELN